MSSRNGRYHYRSYCNWNHHQRADDDNVVDVDDGDDDDIGPIVLVEIQVLME